MNGLFIHAGVEACSTGIKHGAVTGFPILTHTSSFWYATLSAGLFVSDETRLIVFNLFLNDAGIRLILVVVISFTSYKSP